MRVSDLVAHIRQFCPLFQRAVSGGIDWQAIDASTNLQGLRAHVVLTDEDAEESVAQNLIIQTVAEHFDVCVEFPQQRGDERGQVVGDSVDAVRSELCRALVGWSPGADYDSISYAGRELLLINRAKAVYRFSFYSGYQIGRNAVGEPPETWEEVVQDGLPALDGFDMDIDFIDPVVDKNIKPDGVGPDGRIEMKTTEDL